MTQDTTTMPVMASDTAALVEAMARALYEEADVWHLEFPWPTNETADEYRRLATATYNRLSDTLVPVGYRYDHPKFGAYCHTDRRHVHEGWLETPLFTLPELKS